LKRTFGLLTIFQVCLLKKFGLFHVRGKREKQEKCDSPIFQARRKIILLEIRETGFMLSEFSLLSFIDLAFNLGYYKAQKLRKIITIGVPIPDYVTHISFDKITEEINCIRFPENITHLQYVSLPPLTISSQL
jgi:hypothetical protein